MPDCQHGGDGFRYPDVIDYSANINYFGMPEAVKRAAYSGVELSGGYPDTECRKLKGALAGWENRGCGGIPGSISGGISDRRIGRIEPEQIICGNGASELIYGIVRARRPKRALLFAPCFSEYERALCSVGCKTDFHTLKREKGFRAEEAFLDLLRPGIDMIFLCNPNNPTGRLIEPGLLEKIEAKCREMGIFLAVDECFLDFTAEKEKYSMKPFLKENPDLFILKAFTKLFTMPGLRLGYGLCGNREFLDKIKDQLPAWNVSLPAQAAGIAACGEEAFAKGSVAAIGRERERMRKRLLELGLKAEDGRANFLFFHGPEGLFSHCLKRGYYIRDCSNFRGLAKGDYRIAVRSPEENGGLLRALEEYQGMEV